MLKSLLQCSYENHKIIVVDNASSLETYRCLEQEICGLPCELLRSEKNLGFGGGVNLGFEYAKKYSPKYLHVINPDTEVISLSYLQELVTVLESDPNIGVIGPAVMKGNKTDFENTVLPFIALKSAFLFRSRYGKRASLKLDKSCRNVASVHGVCFIVRTDVYEKVNGFDESYFMYGEEQDLCFRIAQLGYKRVFWAGLSIVHAGADKDNGGVIDWRYLYVRRNQVKFLRAHRSWFEAMMLALFFSLNLLVKKLRCKVKIEQYPLWYSVKFITQPLRDKNPYVRSL